MSTGPSLETLVRQAIGRGPQPQGFDEIFQSLPPELLAEHRNPKQHVRNLIKRQRDLAQVARGQYVYLPDRITGSTFRLALTGTEGKDGWLRAGADLAFALWYRSFDQDLIQAGVTAACDVPSGASSWLRVEKQLRNLRTSLGVTPLVVAGPELQEWLASQRLRAGDSLVVQVTDSETPRCTVRLERLAERDAQQIAQRNREVADAVIHIVGQEVRSAPVHPNVAARWLLAAEQYRHPVPPDPLDVLLWTNGRLTANYQGQFSIAGRWEWLRFRDPDPVMVSAEKQRCLADVRQVGIDPLTALRSWLVATGHPTRSADEERSGWVPDAESETRRELVYRLQVASAHRAAGLTIEAKGETKLFDLDGKLRRVLRHDPFDHLSGFCVPFSGSRQSEWLATFNPFDGLEEGEDYELAQLNLQVGDQLAYVYDFGDWYHYAVTVTAVSPAAKGVKYPRIVKPPTGSKASR